MQRHDDPFRDLCDNAHDLIQSVSPEGLFLYVNLAWMRTLGYEAREVAKLNISDIIHPDSREHCQRVMGELMAGHSVVEIEADFRTKDGRRVPVIGNATCHFEGGSLVATRGIFRDVTRRRQIEAERDRFFNLSLDLLCVAGTDGYFKQVNPAFERALGYTRKELLSRAFVEFVHPDDREKTLREVEQLRQGLTTVDFHNRYMAKDGDWRWLAWRAAPLPDQGLVFAVARDITDQKRTQDLLARQAEELARSNADLEQFAYAASHDLSAPLRGISALAEWIEEDLALDHSVKAGEHLGQLRGRVRRMETLIDDLLAYARAGHGAAVVMRVDTATLVRDLVLLLAPKDGLVVKVRPGMPVLETTRAPLELVLRNLIGNAIKHHDRAKGEITVLARDAGRFHEFCVADDGPGIPPESRDQVFLMFQKLKPSDQVDGSGIGLALVKRIVEHHGGQVVLESGSGRGAIFRFTWPKMIVPAD
jgi:PAS domain S-box-containing protein